MRVPEESDFCYYPFMQVLLTSDGRFRPCSKHQDYITHEGRELSVEKGDTLQDAWESDYMTNLRTNFLQNKQFSGCRECWRMQQMGLRSMRYDSFDYQTEENQVVMPTNPTRIEINASNVCNLKCRICYPNASSKWIQEHKDIYGSNERTYFNLSFDNIDIIKRWAPGLKEVCFFGGEPLLSAQNLELLDYFIENGFAGQMSILFNTNGTVFSDEIANRFQHFKLVRMFFSIDDIGERFEYQRKGALWNNVSQNLDRAYRLSRSKFGQNIDFKVCCTVSTLNIFYLPEFFHWLETYYQDLKVFWNFLFDPWQLSIQALPEPVKVHLKARLRRELKPSFEMTNEETRTLDELMDFLDNSIDRDFSGFFTYIETHDKYRGERFDETFPEMNKLLIPYRITSRTTLPTNFSFVSRPDKYPAYNGFERKRSLTEDTIPTFEDYHLLFDGLEEVIKTFGTDNSTMEKVDWLRTNLDQETHGWRNLFDHVSKLGLIKFHDAIEPMGLDEFSFAIESRFNIDLGVNDI